PNLGALLIFFFSLCLSIFLVQPFQKILCNIHCAVFVENKTGFVGYDDRIPFILIVFRTKRSDHRENFLLSLYVVSLIILVKAGLCILYCLVQLSKLIPGCLQL